MAARLEALAPGYLQRVRRASLRLAHRDGSVVDMATALADVEDTAAFDLDVPTLSRRRSGRLTKVAIKKLVSWYLRYLTQQVAAFSAAVTRFAAVVAERSDRLEASSASMQRELQGLGRRVDHLEAALGRSASGPDGDAGPRPG